MMRLISWLIGFVVLIAILAFGTALFLYPRLPAMLSTTLSEKFQVPVEIESVQVKWKTIKIEDMEIANPKVSKIPIALKLKTATFIAPLTHYIKKHIKIDTVHLDNIYVSIEFYDKANEHGNWTVLIDNLDENESFGATERGEDTADKDGRTVVIKKLIMTNITVDLALYGKEVRRLSMIERIEFDDVSSEKGLPTEEITEIIIQKMMEQIFSLQGIANMFKTIIETPAKTAGDILKGIFGG